MSVQLLTPAQIQALGEEYDLKLTGYCDTTPGRTAQVAVLGVVSVLFAGYLAFNAIPSLLPVFNYSGLAQLLVFVATAASPLAFLRQYIIIVPEYTMVQARNIFTGALHTYTTQTSIKYLWEQVGDNDFIDARVIIIEGTTLFLTKDGVPLQFTWTVQCRINKQLLGLNLRNTLEGLAKGLADVVENSLTKNLLGKKAKAVRDPEVVRVVEKEIRGELNALLPETPGGEMTVTTDVENNPIWVRFGIVIELATLGEPQFDKDYREAMTAEAIAEMVKATAAKLVKDVGADPNVALNSALILNKENVSRQAITLEGIDKNLGEVVTSIIKLWREGR